jgi:hypothetical protein
MVKHVECVFCSSVELQCRSNSWTLEVKNHSGMSEGRFVRIGKVGGIGTFYPAPLLLLRRRRLFRVGETMLRTADERTSGNESSVPAPDSSSLIGPWSTCCRRNLQYNHAKRATVIARLTTPTATKIGERALLVNLQFSWLDCSVLEGIRGGCVTGESVGGDDDLDGCDDDGAVDNSGSVGITEGTVEGDPDTPTVGGGDHVHDGGIDNDGEIECEVDGDVEGTDDGTEDGNSKMTVSGTTGVGAGVCGANVTGRGLAVPVNVVSELSKVVPTKPWPVRTDWMVASVYPTQSPLVSTRVK